MSLTRFTDGTFSDTKKALDHLVSTSVTGVVVIGQNKKIEYVNDIVCTTLGYSMDELLGSNFLEYLHPDYRESLDSIYAERVSGDNLVKVYDTQVLSKNGSSVDVQICSTAIEQEQSNVKILAQIVDRTDAESNRRALESIEYKHQVLVETMNEGLGIIDSDGKIAFANSALNELAGFEGSTLVGTPIGDILQGLDLESIITKVSQRRQGMKDRYETTIIHSSGNRIPVLVSASPMYDSGKNYTGSIAVFTDLTEIYEGQQLLQRTFNAFPDPAFLWKRRTDGEIILATFNMPMMKMSKGAASEYIGCQLVDVFKNAPELVNCIQQVFIDGKRIRIEAPFEAHPGPKRWYIWDFIRYSEDSVIMIAIDITHRIKSEEKLQKVNDRALFYLDLLQHDIRNKLQEIQGFTELAADMNDKTLSSFQLDFVLSAISKCTDLIEKTNFLEKLMELPLSNQHLSEAIYDALKQFENIEKIANLRISGPIIQANELLVDMFRLLVENMCRRNTSEKKRLWVKYCERSRFHEITLYDNGPIIPESDIYDVLDPLKRTYGVELLIVRQIVERYDGQISVSNKSDDDQIFRTEFKILFPKSSEM